MEILITQQAKAELDKLLKNSEHKYIRIVTKRESIFEKGRLDFTFDKKEDDDLLFKAEGYEIVINVKLAAQLQNLTISYGGLLSRDKFTVETDFGLFKY
ncbi:iron-sulfur cluster biosynthesis family protein [Romboutsia lituseburensis]|uniref:iron-sulfur cluster biosynthesis family protein n=1 Tax=Romboutsia lituseburensis TaxID=1537 RepID=UPI00215B4714|nr:iron-sulfur cluster biosynthesis family protein [Romboutsia lituseburensis]MCR8746770.1 hypothetical protein [Romboutsia lituseburensis]